MGETFLSDESEDIVFHFMKYYSLFDESNVIPPPESSMMDLQESPSESETVGSKAEMATSESETVESDNMEREEMMWSEDSESDNIESEEVEASEDVIVISDDEVRVLHMHTNGCHLNSFMFSFSDGVSDGRSLVHKIIMHTYSTLFHHISS